MKIIMDKNHKPVEPCLGCKGVVQMNLGSFVVA